jgi:hypothetical protein
MIQTVPVSSKKSFHLVTYQTNKDHSKESSYISLFSVFESGNSRIDLIQFNSSNKNLSDSDEYFQFINKQESSHSKQIQQKKKPQLIYSFKFPLNSPISLLKASHSNHHQQTIKKLAIQLLPSTPHSVQSQNSSSLESPHIKSNSSKSHKQVSKQYSEFQSHSNKSSTISSINSFKKSIKDYLSSPQRILPLKTNSPQSID